jgi:outer membrane biosynthesis protein TonB
MALKSETSNHLKGLVVTVVFHSLAIGILMYVTLATNPPLFPEPEGVEVNFGTDATGLGDVEPGPNADPGKTAVDEETQEQPTVTQTSSPSEVDAPADIQENVITQNHEDAIAIAEKKKAALQVKKAQTEQKKVEDEQKRVADEQQRKIKEMDARAGKLFGKGTGNGSQGIAGGTGNQGNPNGVANSTNYIGSGGNGKGILYNLSGRSALDLPRPEKGIQAAGKVVVSILVDRDGNVIQAYPGVQGSTTSNQQLYDAAQKAAMKTKFNVNANAAERQKGLLTYIFELQ